MALDGDAALERVLFEGDEWESWRALRLSGERVDDPPMPPSQDAMGGFAGPGGRLSPGATGQALCHLKLLVAECAGLAAIALDWLEEVKTPAAAWLDHPEEVPGGLDDHAGGKVWATAAASCGLLAHGRHPGERAMHLLRGEADVDGRFTGGAYPTFAAAGAWWLAEGPRTEMAEWALRWSREETDDWRGRWDRATALIFWAAADIPAEHPSVDVFLDELKNEAPPRGWPDDLGLTLTTLELSATLDQ